MIGPGVLTYWHIDFREHFVHVAVEANIPKLLSFNSFDNVSDLMTMPLTKAPFCLCGKRSSDSGRLFK